MTGGWHKDAALLADAVTVRWPEARVPRTIIINGKPFAWSIGAAPRRFEGAVRFSQGPVPQLQGEVDLVATSRGWSLRWTTDRAGWVAAATLGELGAGTPHEAQRAIAAVLDRWLDDPRHRHHDGTLCPLTHCAVIRGPGGPAALRAAVSAPHIKLNSHWMFFTGSSGGERLSVRAVWGMHGPKATASRAVEGDRWAEWTRSLSSSQVAILKRAVAPGLRPGQAGLMLGPSGPYAVEALRIACGRHFGWTLWPSNAVEAELRADGSLLLKGHGWGHNVGLDLALALDEARQGMKAEDILKEAFGPNAID